MSAGRKRAAGTAKEESTLLTGLRFVMAAQFAPGDAKAQAPYQQHCRFANGYVMAFNGILAAGYPVGEEMQGCPNTFLFIKALEKVRGAYSLTLLDNLSLSINGASFKANVPCITPVDLENIWDDGAQWDLGDEFRTAAIKAGVFSTDGAQTVMAASVLTLERSLVGTDGTVLVEAWHGWGMPPGLIIPMAFIDALAKIPFKLVKFGFTENRSLTVYFENGAWLRTQLYQENFPRVERVIDGLNMEGQTPIPADFWTALDAVVPFCETNTVLIENNELRSHENPAKGASHKCDGVPFARAFSHKYLHKLKPLVTHANFVASDDMAVLTGEQLRVVLMKINWR